MHPWLYSDDSMRLYVRRHPEEKEPYYCQPLDSLMIHILLIRKELGLEERTSKTEIISIRNYIYKKLKGKFIGSATSEMIDAVLGITDLMNDEIKIITTDLDFLRNFHIIDSVVENLIKEYLIEQESKRNT